MHRPKWRSGIDPIWWTPRCSYGLVKCRIKRVDRSGGAGFATHQRKAALLLRLNRPAFEPKGLALFQFVSRWAFEMTDPHVELAWLHVEGIGRQRFVAFDESSCQFIS